MKVVLLNSKEDLAWLFETHLKSNEDLEWVKQNTKSALVFGNEDCPEEISCYNKENPEITESAFFIWKGE